MRAALSRPSDNPAELLLATTWRPTLSYVGIDGVPGLDGGMVLRPHTTLALSLRLPPTVDAEAAKAQLIDTLTADPPSGAKVTLDVGKPGKGWDAPTTAPWLETALHDASRATFGRPPGAMGIGGGIPFMSMLGDQFPDAQFVITGVLGPESNAHGPNEFLHLPTAEKVTASVAHLLNAHAIRHGT